MAVSMKLSFIGAEAGESLQQFKSWFQQSDQVNHTDWITLPEINLIAREINEITSSSVQDPVSASSDTPFDFIDLLSPETLIWVLLLKMMYFKTRINFGAAEINDCSMIALVVLIHCLWIYQHLCQSTTQLSKEQCLETSWLRHYSNSLPWSSCRIK